MHLCCRSLGVGLFALAMGCAPSGLQPVDPRQARPGDPVAPAPVPPEEDDGWEEPVDPPPPPPDEPSDEPDDPVDPPDDPVDPPEDPPDPPEDPPDDTPTGPPSASADVACFPGDDMSWTTCLATLPATGLGSDYAYPAPLNGSAQYAAPTRVLDLQAHPGSTKLAPNFRLDEIAQLYKGRYAVVQPHAVERLQDLRDQLGALIVNSGYRSPGYNSGIGGATWSRHMYGDGFDIDPVSVSLSALQSACNAHGASYVGVYTSHMHCDWRNDPLSTAFYGSAGSNAFTWELPAFDGAIAVDAGRLVAPAVGWDEGEPLREWVAFDADGWAIDTFVGETWDPPPGTASVEVWIGREIVRTLAL